jgi:hypothetical protein
MILDQATLVALASAITGLLGVLMLVPWWQERGMRALAGAAAMASRRSCRMRFCSSPAAKP